MTVASVKRRPWWQYLPIPESWWLSESNDRDAFRERSRERDDLEDTRSFRRRYEEPPSAPPTPRIQVPLGVIVTIVIYLIGQLATSVWWAATLQSNLQHEIMDRAKEEQRLWDSIQAYRAEVGALRVDIARSGNRPRQSADSQQE